VSGAEPWVEQRPEATAHLIESLREIADVARVRGVRVTIETFPRSRPPGQLLGPTSVALAVLEEVGAAELGLTIDLSHLVQLHEDVAESAQALATRSRHVHLSTCVMDFGHPLEGDQHPSFAETGIALSVEAAAHALTPLRDRVDVVSVEIRRHHAEPAEQFIPACASWWQTATGQVLRGPGG
jgi:sugar phosphate isomerase/epimerase